MTLKSGSSMAASIEYLANRANEYVFPRRTMGTRAEAVR